MATGLTLERRSLGDLEVTVVGLGCNNFGGRVDLEGTRAVVDAALEAGINHIDTADTYGRRGPPRGRTRPSQEHPGPGPQGRPQRAGPPTTIRGGTDAAKRGDHPPRR